MTWSKWFVAPALTSVFFLLGVLTLYWFITNRLIKYLEKRHDHVDGQEVQAIFGLLYMALLMMITQLAVNGTPDGWVFVNFQIFAVIFLSYFIRLKIQIWQIFIVIIAFMALNGTLTIPLSWLFMLIYVGLYFAMTYIRRHRHGLWRDFAAYTLVNLVFSTAMWIVMFFRFHLPWTTIAWEILFSFFFMTVMFVYIDSILAGASTLAQLTYTTNFDELTSVRNYYAFKNEFGMAFERAQTHHEPLTLMLFDIDHFKHVNDTYGHLAGDYVLTSVAQLITAQLKVIGDQPRLYRTGGEEFTIVFPNYSLHAAQQHVDAIAQAVRDQPFHHNGQTIAVSISAGVTQFQTTDEDQLDIYRRADQHLYYSKRHGRDQVTVD